MEGLDFEKIDGYALIHQEDKGEKVPVLKRRNGVLQGNSWEWQNCSVKNKEIKLVWMEFSVGDGQKLGCRADCGVRDVEDFEH